MNRYDFTVPFVQLDLTIEVSPSSKLLNESFLALFLGCAGQLLANSSNFPRSLCDKERGPVSLSVSKVANFRRFPFVILFRSEKK